MEPMKQDIDHLPDRQQRIIQRVASGQGWREAARAEGCKDSYARVIRTRMQKNPAVAKAIESIRAEGRKIAVYGLVEAMQEAEDAASFAKLHKNPMANVKACELRAKLSGLLIDRVEVVEVDLTGALARAHARVLTIGAIGPTALPVPSRGPIDWLPHIPGNPVADTQAGGESGFQVNNGGQKKR